MNESLDSGNREFRIAPDTAGINLNFMTPTTSKFQGICPAVVTPCGKDDRLEEEALAKQISALYGEGVHGLYLCGLTGDGYLMSLEERKRTAEIGVASSKGRGYTIAHVGTQDVRSTCLLAEHAAASGVKAVAAIPPLNRSHGEICIFYRELVRAASGLPVFIYHIPVYTHSQPSLDQFKDLVGIDGVSGLKFTDYNLHLAGHLLAMKEDLLLLYGRDEQLLAGFLFGAQAGVGSTYNVFAKHYVELWDAAMANDWNKAKLIQKKNSALFRILEEFGLMPGIEAILKRRGLLHKCFRQPATCLSAQQSDELHRRLDHEFEKLNY